jgi:hypothetical protein
MDPGDELRLREIQREYLDFLDDDVIKQTSRRANQKTWVFGLVLD